MSTIRYIMLAGLMICCSAGLAMADGFRPESGREADFLEAFRDSRIVVYPANIRDPDRTSLSVRVRDAVADYLRSTGVAQVIASDEKLSLHKPDEGAQFQIFNGSLGKIAARFGRQPAAGDYVILFDVVFPPSRSREIEVFGIHLYIVTADGENAFSFLLNSHHESFVAATLRSADKSAKGREALALRSVEVAMEALDEQMRAAADCLAVDATKGPFPVASDLVADFEHELVRVVDSHGVPIGYSEFHGKNSSAMFDITSSHPPREGEADGNHVLRIDADVVRWAGVMQRFEDAAGEHWISYDWSDKTGIAFWFRGQGQGTEIVFDVLDNRHACSTVDDAQRFSTEFVDDVTGWQRVVIPFETMHLKNIGNAAPVDEFDLSAVTGWGIGILRTNGEATFYIDDLRLLPAGP